MKKTLIKEELINKALHEPYSFTWDDVLRLCADDQFTFHDIREMIKRIYDINEEILLETSDAKTGSLGKKNKSSTEKRIKRYNARIKKGVKYHPKGKIILAEGDSWFQFPVLITDIIDWLNKEENYAIYSMAYGGDWITNIIYEETYIGELAVHKPDAFLISGGGNDLVGGNRLAVMVSPIASEQVKRTKDEINALNDVDEETKNHIISAQPYVKKEFYAFVNTLTVMYQKMLSQIENSGKYDDMLIITQGYDYAFPRWNKFRVSHPYQTFSNWLAGSGKWLIRPMSIKGIPADLQRPIIMTMMLELNEMFKKVASQNKNIFHIDCRGTAPKEEDWMDELHLKSHKYKEIAKIYNKMIDKGLEGCKQEWPGKIVRVVDS